MTQPGPPVPDSVWEAIYSCDDARGVNYPMLNEATKKALLKMAAQSDYHPASWMLKLGEYLSTHFTSNEIGGFIRDLGMYTTSNDPKNSPTKSCNSWSTASPPKQRSIAQLSPPKRVAQLAHDLILEAGDCTTWHTMAQTAGRLMYLSQDEVKLAAMQVGLDGEGSKVLVIVRLIEKIYSDVLLPPPTKHKVKMVNAQQYQYSGSLKKTHSTSTTTTVGLSDSLSS
jgi:hypothetical protein